MYYFTFHYVSILIFVKLAASVACPVFTFHYVSILMNEYDLKATGFSTFTFHYVSILMQHGTVLSGKCPFLYIPLCFYFNTCLVIRLVTVLSLYIPLCLYFNFMPDVSTVTSSDFTFHYVSILIQNNFAGIGVTKNFTFHYVSILIPPA